jgi:hypothetical protein
MVECWKPVLDYEDLYAVSDRGRVRRIAGGQGARAGHILRPGDNSRGYPCVLLYRNGHHKTRTVHSIVVEAFFGPRPPSLEVNHKNGIRKDNRAANLEYATSSENMKHSYRVLGRKVVIPRGEAQGRAKLTASIVRDIRRLYAKGGITYRDLAERYGVSPATICHILHRKTWAHVA